jgi:hypothetical protein
VLTQAQCEDFMAAFDSVLLDLYDQRRYERPIGRLGPVLNEFACSTELPAKYWQLARSAESYWSGISAARNVRAACRRHLVDVWGTGVETAVIGDRPIFWGIVREAGAGTLIHWDEVVRERPLMPMHEIAVAQLACNVFISVPEQGGATSVWRHRWQPEDERHRRRFGYTEATVATHPKIMVAPGLGDAVFFDSRNYHRAEGGAGGRRVSLSFFVGVTTSGRLLLWS